MPTMIRNGAVLFDFNTDLGMRIFVTLETMSESYRKSAHGVLEYITSCNTTHTLTHTHTNTHALTDPVNKHMHAYMHTFFVYIWVKTM